MNCCLWQQFQSHHNVLLVLLLLRLQLAGGIYVAADLSYGAAHLSGAALAGSSSTLLQIANVALNNKWTTRSSFSRLFELSLSVAAASFLFIPINHKLHTGSALDTVTGGCLIHTAHFITFITCELSLCFLLKHSCCILLNASTLLPVVQFERTLLATHFTSTRSYNKL